MNNFANAFNIYLDHLLQLVSSEPSVQSLVSSHTHVSGMHSPSLLLHVNSSLVQTLLPAGETLQCVCDVHGVRALTAELRVLIGAIAAVLLLVALPVLLDALAVLAAELVAGACRV